VYIVLLLGSAGGVFARRLEDGARCGACLRAGLVTPHSGGPARPGGIYDPSARSSLDRAVSGLRARRRRPGVEPAAPTCPESRDVDLEARTRDQKSPRWSAAGRARLAKRAHASPDAHTPRQAWTNGSAVRRSIPSAWPRRRRKAPQSGAGTTAYPAPPRIRAMTLACLLSPTRRRGRDQKIPPPKPLSVRNKVSKPITRCTAAFFLAISARFPVGVKRPFMRPSSTLLAPGGSVSSASSVYQLRLRPP